MLVTAQGNRVHIDAKGGVIMIWIRLLVAACMLGSGFAQAQSWPSRPVRFVVPFPPGGSTDVAARTLADRLTRSMGAQFVVENRSGGGGSIGTTDVARASADGHTILFAADAVTTLPLVVKNLQYDILRDFSAITQVTTQPLAVAVHPSLPVKSLQDLVAYAKANPGKLSFAHSGTGTGQHMSGELLKKLAGIDMVHVPYKGGGPAVQDLVGGQVPMGVLGSTPLIPHHKAGRIRIIAFTSQERFAPLPDIATVHESGFPGFNTSQWLGLMAPRGTPAAVIERLQAATAEALAAPEVKERLAGAALIPVGNKPAEFDAVIRADIEQWSKLARELGLQPQ
jgi:tripartite-type tricarboxylate transporter receptor subunit TctC